MRADIALLTLALLLASNHVQAEQKTEAPSGELLDFLGEWERIDGEWIDPNQVQDISMLEHDRLNGEKNAK